jgi:CRISPR-associated protein Csx3
VKKGVRDVSEPTTCIKYNIKEGVRMVVIEFEIPGGVLDVARLGDAIAAAPAIPGTKIVGISGRGPVWLYAALTHHYHYARAVATYEPRLGKFIVVVTHTPELRVGDVIDFE